MYAAERQQHIVRSTQEQGRVDVTSLAAELDVTVETIRRDLAALEARGLVRRVHGGALPVTAQGFEPALAERTASRAEEKHRIAHHAAQLVDTGVRTIILDAGSTTSALALALPKHLPEGRELTVVTNALPIAVALSSEPLIHLHLLGGRIRARTLAAVGADTEAQIRDLTVDIAFLGTNGLHPRRGLTTPNPEEASAKRAMAEAAQSVVVLADSSKLGQTHLCRVIGTERIDQLVTDSDAEPELLDELRMAGTEVMCA